MKIFFDGGCRPNPGRIEITVVALGVVHHVADLGRGTNNDAEWLAAIHALAVAIDLGLTDVQLLGDSATVVGQANGAKCRSPELTAHLAAFKALRQRIGRVRVRRIGRSQNLAGIVMAKRHAGR